MFVLGLTGGIACGKSTVATWLVARGATHLDADQLAREVVARGTSGLQAVLERFGPHLQLRDGELDRRALGELVFADAHARRALEELLHPRIRARLEAGLAAAKARSVSLVVIDAALLFELGLDRHCDATLAVICDPETQIARLASRNGLDRHAALQRLAAQSGQQAYRSRATWSIANDTSIGELHRNLESLLQGLQLDRREASGQDAPRQGADGP